VLGVPGAMEAGVTSILFWASLAGSLAVASSSLCRSTGH
jgi:hypothetical protein